MSTSEFRTKNLHESTILVRLGKKLLRAERSGNQAIYCFENSPDISEILSDFLNGELRLEPRALFDTWRDLRSMAYQITDNVK